MIHDLFEKQLLQDESWKYVLAVLENGTVHFKIKLTQILSNDFERSHLEHLEVFQHRFLKMDEQIGLLKHELRELQEALKQVDKMVLTPENIKELRRMPGVKIEGIRDSFDILSADFSMYLHESFPGICFMVSPIEAVNKIHYSAVESAI
jgi:DNA-binding transcriptional regulator YiaG